MEINILREKTVVVAATSDSNGILLSCKCLYE